MPSAAHTKTHIYVYIYLSINLFVCMPLCLFGLHAFLSIYLSIFAEPFARAEYDKRSIFKRSLTGLNSEFEFRLVASPRLKNSLSYYLPIAKEIINGFISYPRVLVLCELQSVSSRIWTRVAMSISYDDNHYTTPRSVFPSIGVSIYISIHCYHIYIYIYIYMGMFVYIYIRIITYFGVGWIVPARI